MSSRNWCFTDFELLDWASLFKKVDNIRYVCVGEEICPTTKKKHNQGWLQLKKNRKLGWLKRNIDNSTHFIKCLGDEASNEKYCQKDGQYKTLGDYKTQGRRTDIWEAKEDLFNPDIPMYDVAEEHFVPFVKYSRGFAKVRELAIYKRALAKPIRDIEVHLIMGPTGCGKTSMVWDAYEDRCIQLYPTTGSRLKWWDGYESQSAVLIDEYDNNLPVTELLSLLDNRPLRIAVKGGTTWACWSDVYITTNLTWDQIHSKAKPEHKKALARRITHWHDFWLGGGEEKLLLMSDYENVDQFLEKNYLVEVAKVVGNTDHNFVEFNFDE